MRSTLRFSAAFALLAPGLALACTVCGQGEGTKSALLVMTIIMTVLPLTMIFGVIGWAVHRVRKAEREDRALAAHRSHG